MSDSINVRVTLGSYDIVHPAEKQTQVYVQIPEVGRASWLLDASFYGLLKDEPWPHVVDSAHEEYERRGVVSDAASEAARKAIVDWLLRSEGADYDARYDAVQAAWEADQARQHPVARKLLERNERLAAQVTELKAERADERDELALALGRDNGTEWGDLVEFAAGAVSAEAKLHARIAELEQANAGLDDLRVRALDKNDTLRARIAELEAERAGLADRLYQAAMARVWRNEDGKKFVFVEDIAPALLGTDTDELTTTVFRASHDSIVMGLYTTREAAREHCQKLMERASVATLEWRRDGEWREDDDEAAPDEAEELYEYGTHETSTWNPTGYVVTPLEVASEYDEEADE